MFRQEPILFQITYSILLLCACTMPITSWFLLPAGALLWVVSFVSFLKTEKGTCWKNRENCIFFALFLLFFLLNFIGIFYSQNKHIALSKMESYLWFFVTPPLFWALDSQQMTRKRIEMLLYAFLLSMACIMLLNYAVSCKVFFETGHSYHFFYIFLSHFMHPSYQALYACIAMLFSFYFITKRRYRTLFTLFSLFLLLYVFMLQSKAGILASILFMIFAGLYGINRKKSRYIVSALFVIAFLTVPLFLVKNIHTKVNRIDDFIESLKKSQNKEGATDARILIWKNAWEVAVDNLPFGTGPGDVHEELNRAYDANGLPAFRENNYNAHNQYLETLAGLGILGLLSLLSLFIYPFIYGVKNRDILLPVFVVIVLFFLLFESMLERKAGGNFIALFLALLFYRAKLKADAEQNNG